MFLKGIEGAYEPSFFIIRLSTLKSIDVAAKENISTFTHEYIHFLQDLILPYCIRENLVHLAIFADHMDEAKRTGEIRMPKIKPLNDINITSRQSEMTWGCNRFVESVSRILDVNLTQEHVEEYGFNLHKYDFILEDESSYQFGARDLLEYIACKIESKHFPSDERLPDLPYYAVDKLIKYYECSYLNDFKRIALVEYCLFNDNPAHRLMTLLKELKAGCHYKYAHGSDYEFTAFLSTANWKSTGVPYETIYEKLNRRIHELKDGMNYRFPESAFPEIYLWLQKSIDYSKKFMAGRSFFAQLFEADTPKFFGLMSTILEEVGIPLIVNDAGEIGTSLSNEEGKDQFLQLLLAYEFIDYLKRDDIQCPMIQVCERDNYNLTNVDCLDAPFRRALEDDLCPFGAFAKTHGLDRVKWYLNDKIVSSQRSHW